MQKQFVSGDEGFAAFSAMESGDASVESHVVLETTWSLESSGTLNEQTDNYVSAASQVKPAG